MRAMLALAYSFGFRKGELLSLKVGDVDLMEGILRLRDSKNGEPRQVSLTAETRGLLAACIDGKSRMLPYSRGEAEMPCKIFAEPGRPQRLPAVQGCCSIPCAALPSAT